MKKSTQEKSTNINNLETNEYQNKNIKTTDVNILLNRVKLNQRNEIKKKFYFFTAASTGLILFGIIVTKIFKDL